MTHFKKNIITERNSALRRKMKPFLEVCEILNWYILSFKSFLLLKKKNCYVMYGMALGVRSWILSNGNESC